MYNSQYYTCEQIDQRLLQGYLDDYNAENDTSLTKAQFLHMLSTIIGKSATVDNLVAQLGYYICDTASGTAAKILAVAGYELFNGGSIKVKFINKNTANNGTLNINNKGAKALYYQGERVSSSNTWEANEIVEIYYDGEAYYANNVKGGSGDGIYDVSLNNLIEGQPTTYASLTAALAAVPVNVRKGGMSLKFIQQLTPATYNVVRTDDVEDEPTGTEIQDDWAIVSGTYIAAQLSGKTLPTNVGDSITYYRFIERTVEVPEHYTTWVITKATADKTEYVQYRLMSTKWSAYTVSWTNEKIAADTSLKKLLVKYDSFSDAGYETTTKSNLRIVNGIVTEYEDFNGRVSYTTKTLHKGDIIHFHGEATDNRVQIVGFTKINPDTLDSLVGLNVGEYGYSRYAAHYHDYDIVVPEDDVYVVLYRFTQDWIKREFNLYLNDFDDIRTAISDIKKDVEGLDDKTDDIAVTNRANVQYVNPDYSFYNTSITNNVIRNNVGDNAYRVEVYNVKKNEGFYVLAIQEGAGNAQNFSLWKSTILPAVGSEVELIKTKSLSDGINIRYSFIADEDCYVLVRRFARETIFVQAWKRNTALDNLSLYIREMLDYTTSGATGYICCNPNSENYGAEVAQNFYQSKATDFIDVTGVAFINILLRYVAIESMAILNQRFGHMFYNADKQPLSVIATFNVDKKGHTIRTTIPVPADAVYARFTVRDNEAIIAYKKTLSSFYNDVEPVNNKASLLLDIYGKTLGETHIISIVPSVSDTYNAYYMKSQNIHFSTGSNYLNRLTYFPNYIIAGGEELSFDYTGLNVIAVFELTYRPTGTSPISTYSSDEIIKNTSFPAASSESFTGHATIKLDSRCRRVAFVFGATQNVRIKPSDITNNITNVTLPIVDTDVDFITEEDLNKRINDKRLLSQISQAKFVASSPTIKSLGLLHFSDIHGDQTSADVINDFILNFSQYITDVLCTGDSVHYYADSSSSYPHAAIWWKENLADKSLFILGNHDSATASATEYDQIEGSAAWDGKGKDWCFETYIEPYINTLGYIMPNGYDDETSPNYHACYWHKDYAEQKIRIIGLDCLHRFDGILDPETGAITGAGVKWTTNEQELWLIEKLNETLDSTNTAYGYSVIVACHYPIDDFDGNNEEWDDAAHKFIYNNKATGGRIMGFKTGAPTVFHIESSLSYDGNLRFCMNNRIDDGYTDKSKVYPNYKKGSTNNIANILQNWMNRGGKFVAWICGHNHLDRMYYPTKYPDILCVVIDQAGCLRGTSSGNRSVNLDSRVCANYYSIDTQNGLFKIVRVGYTMNKLMNSHEYLCYDYINRVVLNEG